MAKMKQGANKKNFIEKQLIITKLGWTTHDEININSALKPYKAIVLVV